MLCLIVRCNVPTSMSSVTASRVVPRGLLQSTTVTRLDSLFPGFPPTQWEDMFQLEFALRTRGLDALVISQVLELLWPIPPKGWKSEWAPLASVRVHAMMKAYDPIVGVRKEKGMKAYHVEEVRRFMDGLGLIPSTCWTRVPAGFMKMMRNHGMMVHNCAVFADTHGNHWVCFEWVAVTSSGAEVVAWHTILRKGRGRRWLVVVLESPLPQTKNSAPEGSYLVITPHVRVWCEGSTPFIDKVVMDCGKYRERWVKGAGDLPGMVQCAKPFGLTTVECLPELAEWEAAEESFRLLSPLNLGSRPEVCVWCSRSDLRRGCHGRELLWDEIHMCRGAQCHRQGPACEGVSWLGSFLPLVIRVEVVGDGVSEVSTVPYPNDHTDANIWNLSVVIELLRYQYVESWLDAVWDGLECSEGYFAAQVNKFAARLEGHEDLTSNWFLEGEGNLGVRRRRFRYYDRGVKGWVSDHGLQDSVYHESRLSVRSVGFHTIWNTPAVQLWGLAKLFDRSKALVRRGSCKLCAKTVTLCRGMHCGLCDAWYHQECGSPPFSPVSWSKHPVSDTWVADPWFCHVCMTGLSSMCGLAERIVESVFSG